MSPTPFEAHLDVTKTLIGMALMVLIAVGGLVFAWIKRGGAEGSTFSPPMIIGVVVFFVMAGVAFKQYKTYQSGQTGPVVRIDANGILDIRVGSKVIPWSAITEAKIANVATGGKFKATDDDKREFETMGIVLTVTNASSYTDGEGALAAAGKAVGEATGHNTIHMRADGLKTTVEEMMAAIEAHRER